jgi:ADP-heptose:LPS heptosyltransferase
MIVNLKNLVKLLIYGLINLSISPSREIKQKSLLLVRLDAIGDYILFRNFIESLKKNQKYNNYKITLLGNNVWKNLSKELDYEYVDNFIWLDRNKFNKNLIYRYKKLKEITFYGYEVVINPTYSREYYYSDTIVKLLTANEKIGSISDTSNLKISKKNVSDKYYTKLISTKKEIMFEFYRNKDFFEKLLEENLLIGKPEIKLKENKLSFNLPQKYAIFFVGAGKNFRKWDIQKFAVIAKHLKDNYGYTIVLCGGPNDINESKSFKQYFNDDYLDFVEKTTLIELLYVINNGNIIISNDTAAPHIAVALGMKNVFVISNGFHLGRFVPYPKNLIENYHVIYHPEIEKNLDDFKKLCNTYRFGSELNINNISIDSVKEKLDMAL